MEFPPCRYPICAMLEKQPQGFSRMESRGPYLVLRISAVLQQ